MDEKTIGFIGGGRVTRIILAGFKRKNQSFGEIVVSDIEPDLLDRLKKKFPEISLSLNDNLKAASQDLVFAAVHPPVLAGVLEEIKPALHPDSILVSLAPKLTIAKIAEYLGGFNRIVRMIPNACSIINAGYNPVSFSQGLNDAERKTLSDAFSILGRCPEVEEEKLEAYAVLTAMGPTYLWFQFHELTKIGKSFGLSADAIRDALHWMGIGAADTLFNSGLSDEEVMDLIPVKPLAEDEEMIRDLFRKKIGALYRKLKD